MDSLALGFLELIHPRPSDTEDLFNSLLGDNTPKLEQKLVFYIQNHPESLVSRLDGGEGRFIFDFFYEKLLRNQAVCWHDSFLEIVQLLDQLEEDGMDTSQLKQNSDYIVRLQETGRSLSKVFRALIESGFSVGECESLVYSVVMRGELPKLKILSTVYSVEDCPAILDVSLRFGRHDIIAYCFDILGLDAQDYGRIVDFQNYKSSRIEFGREWESLGTTVPNYSHSLRLVLENYYEEITVQTLQIWCDLIRESDVIPESILTLLRSKVKEIPLHEDFGEFNGIILGKIWCDRDALMEEYRALERKYSDLSDRYEMALHRWQQCQEYQEQGHRIRRDTT